MKKQNDKQLLVFGYGLPVICFFLAWRQYVKHGLTGWVEALILAAVIVLAMALFIKPWLKALFKYWMKGAQAIGSVVTTIILSVFFFFVLTPASIILRLAGKDYMNLKRKSPMDSYWIKRAMKKEDYTQQF